MHSEKLANFLEKRNWTRSVAGETDFNNALKAMELMRQYGLGILISGEYGAGKTTLANAIVTGLPYLHRVYLGLPGGIEKLTSAWESNYACPCYGRNIFIDDVGVELTKNDFGIHYEIFSEFVVRYHARKMKDVRLFLTTNMTESQMDGRYGGRVISRLKDLCVPLRLTGPDKRQWRCIG